MKKKEKAEFGLFPPTEKCDTCDGRGEIKDQYVSGGFLSIGGHWTYAKCQNCNGTGKNLWHCITCKELINNNFWCSNEKCKMYNIKVALAEKRES